MANKRIASEGDYFDQRVAKESEKGDFYTHGAALESYHRLLSLAGDMTGKRVLDLGCGNGWAAVNYARKGAGVTGIDVSLSSLKMAKDFCKEREQDHIHFVLGAAEKMPFKPKFDIVVGISILHHLELDKAVQSIKNAMADGGKALFIEPLAHNPLINLFRILTPDRRTSDERPLAWDSIKGLEKDFRRVTIHGYDLVALAAFMLVPFRAYKLFNSVKTFLGKLDRILFYRMPEIQRFCWGAIIMLEN